MLEQSVPDITGKQCDKLLRYMDLVLDRNQYINLTAITDPEDFIRLHYIDSLGALFLPEFGGAAKVIDVGTGAGFPGVPLAILKPDKEFTLLDSLNKRLRIVREFCEELDIGNVKILHGRAEDAGRDPGLRETFDFAVSRAVAGMPVLCEYCLPFVRECGYFLAYKGPDGEEECAASEKALKTLGGRLIRVEKGRIENLHHTLCLIGKTGRTPAEFPRRAGIPAKAPIE